jgi:hypothetical protein
LSGYDKGQLGKLVHEIESSGITYAWWLTGVQYPVDWTVHAVVHAHAVNFDPVARAIVRRDILSNGYFGKMYEQRTGMVEVLCNLWSVKCTCIKPSKD